MSSDVQNMSAFLALLGLTDKCFSLALAALTTRSHPPPMPHRDAAERGSAQREPFPQTQPTVPDCALLLFLWKHLGYTCCTFFLLSLGHSWWKKKHSSQGKRVGRS